MTWIWSLSPVPSANRLQFTSVPPRCGPELHAISEARGLASTGHVDYHTPVLDTTFPLAADKTALFGGHITWLMPASINPPSLSQPLTPTLGLLDSKPSRYLCPSYWDPDHQPISSFMIKTHTCCPFLFKVRYITLNHLEEYDLYLHQNRLEQSQGRRLNPTTPIPAREL